MELYAKVKKLLPITIPLALLLSSIIINLLYDYHEVQDIDGMYQMIKEVEGPDKQVKRITFSLYIDIDSESFWGLLQLSDNKEKRMGKYSFPARSPGWYCTTMQFRSNRLKSTLSQPIRWKSCLPTLHCHC
ncbi:hypothetical protein ACWAU3_21755 [Shewanella sp. JL219SE-S6]